MLISRIDLAYRSVGTSAPIARTDLSAPAYQDLGTDLSVLAY
jgi:hypothetical protein